MNLIAIDPGPEQSALLVWDAPSRIVSANILPNTEVRSLIRDRRGCQLCIEMIASYGMPVGAEVFATCVWIGRFCEAWENGGYSRSKLITRHTIKMHHCHNARAKDSNIRQALIDKYGKPGTKKAPGLTYGLHDDLWAAFALATYVTETSDHETIH